MFLSLRNDRGRMQRAAHALTVALFLITNVPRPAVAELDCDGGQCPSNCCVVHSGNSAPHVPNLMVAVPSGRNGYFLTLKNASNQTASTGKVWLGENLEWYANLSAPRMYSFPSAPTTLDCWEDDFCVDEFSGDPVVGWKYFEVDGNPGTFYPTWGRTDSSNSADLVVDVEYETVQGGQVCGPGYSSAYITVAARSTDMDGDGDTDQKDKFFMGRRLVTGGLPWLNLNATTVSDGTINEADYLYLVHEMRHEQITGPDTICFCPEPNDYDGENDPTVKVALDAIFETDAIAPDSCKLSIAPSGGGPYKVSWRASGDDYKFGVADTFDLRYSGSRITDANFNSATRVPVATPVLAGGQMSFTSGASTPTKTYWAIKAIDHAYPTPNVSALSLDSTLFVSDTTAPDTCKLSITAGLAGAYTISWRATGDDFRTGIADTFDLRYSTSPITSANFSSATRVVTPTPGLPGAIMTYSANTCDVKRYWAIKTIDHAYPTPNASAISPLDSTLVSTPAVSNVTACALGKNCVMVSYHSLGGTDVVVSSWSSISGCGFVNASPLFTVTSSADQYREFLIEGLSQGTTYYFAVKTLSGGLWSTTGSSGSATTFTWGDACDYESLCGESVRPTVGEIVPFELAPPAPNPVRDAAVFVYSVSHEMAGQRLDLGIFDLAGRRVATLASGTSREGRFQVTWNAERASFKHLKGGVYFVRLMIGTSVLRQRVVVTS